MALVSRRGKDPNHQLLGIQYADFPFLLNTIIGNQMILFETNFFKIIFLEASFNGKTIASLYVR